MASMPDSAGDLADIGDTVARGSKKMKDGAVVPHVISGGRQFCCSDIGSEQRKARARERPRVGGHVPDRGLGLQGVRPCLSAARDSMASYAPTASCDSRMTDALFIGIILWFMVVGVLFLVTLNRW